MSENKAKFNDNLCRLWEMANGYWSLPLGTEEYDNFMKHIQHGGRVVVKINKKRKNDKSPHAWLEIISPEEVQKMEKSRPPRNTDPADSI